MHRIYPKTTVYSILSDKIPSSFAGFRIAVLADLHNCELGENNRALLKALLDARPDCILIAGDLITEEKRGRERVLYKRAGSLLPVLRRIAPVYYGLGNHEQRWKEKNLPERKCFADYRAEMEAEGIVFLDNRSLMMCRGDGSVRITGLALPGRYFSKTRKKSLSANGIRKLVGEADQKTYQILLAHTPAFADAYSSWGADLTLVGHYHGGVIRLPVLGGVISTGYRLFPRYDHGRFRLRQGEMIVSSGLGSHTIPIRVNNPPELVILELRGDV